MSIPADFRRVLEQGDPNFPEARLPRMVVLHGPHLVNRLQAYTINGMSEIEAGIDRLPRGSPQRKYAARTILGKSWETAVDREGRVVLPQRLRQQIGLDTDATFVAMGDHFEIWNTATYLEVEAAETQAWLDQQPEGFDPLSLIDMGG